MGRVKNKFGYDDALDAFGCHGVGGIFGGIATGIFASQKVNPDIMCNGLIYGDVKLFLVQILSIVVTIVIAVVATFVIIKIMKVFTDIRVSELDEANGLDISQHNESAYPSFMGLD